MPGSSSNPSATLWALPAAPYSPTSPGLLAEIVDISRFPDHPELAAYAGLTWKRSQSDSFEAEDTRLNKTGSPILRHYFTQGANAIRRHNLEYKAYYWRKYRESRKHKHKRALVLTARKLVRLVYTLLAQNKPYAMPQAALKQKQEEMIAVAT